MLYALIMAATLTQDSARFAPIAQIMERAIAQRAFPGGVVAIGTSDSVQYLEAFGRHEYDRGPRVTIRTMYDIASLTKVVGLTTAVMRLVDERRLDLDGPLPGFEVSPVTARDLLLHRSGLPAWQPFYQRGRGRAEVFALARQVPQEVPAGRRMTYSDVGAIRLTELVETLSGERLDRFLTRILFKPLGMRDTRFAPDEELLERIAPTERDTTWRHRLVHGEVHDENAAAMGGVSGHAGMFSTAPDLARFARWMLSCFSRSPLTAHRSPASCETVRAFAQRADSAFSSRAIGWDTPTGTNSAGTMMSARAFGHTGFTGTSIWVDPERNLFVILLTNRVYPTRENQRIFEVRRAVADAAARAAGG